MKARLTKGPQMLPLLALSELSVKRAERAELLARIKRHGQQSHVAARLRPRLTLITAEIAALEKGLRA